MVYPELFITLFIGKDYKGVAMTEKILKRVMRVLMMAALALSLWGGMGKTEAAGGQNILLVYDNSGIRDAFQSVLVQLGHTVTSSTTVPVNPTPALTDQIWDVRWTTWGDWTSGLPAADQTNLRFFMANGGRVALFCDWGWGGNDQRHRDFETFVNSVAASGTFKIQDSPSSSSTSAVVGDSADAQMINPVDYNVLVSQSYPLDNPGYVNRPTDLAGGYPVLVCNDHHDRSVGIAFTQGNMKATYGAARLFIFTDHGNATNVNGTPASSNILRFIASFTSSGLGGLTFNPDSGAVLSTLHWNQIVNMTSSTTLKPNGDTLKSKFLGTSVVSVNAADSLSTNGTLNYVTWPAKDTITVKTKFATDSIKTSTLIYTFVTPKRNFGWKFTGLRTLNFYDSTSALFTTATFGWDSGTTNFSTIQNPTGKSFGGTTANVQVRERITYYTYANGAKDTINKTIPMMTFKLTDDSTGKSRIIKAGTVMNIWSEVDSAGHVVINNGKAYGVLTAVSFINAGGNAVSTLSAINSSLSSFTFTPTKVASQVIIQGTFTDVATGLPYTALDTFQIVPGSPSKLTVETSNTGITSPHVAIQTITIASASQTSSGYAYIWDAYGNYIGRSTSTSWSIISNPINAISGVASGVVVNGEGVVTRNGTKNGVQIGKIQLIDGTLADSAWVTIDAVSYSQLQIIDAQNVVRSGTTITLSVDSGAIYFSAQAKNSLGNWDNYSGGTWSLDNTSIATISSTGGVSTNFTPTDTGVVHLTLSASGMTSVLVTFHIIPGKPKSLVLYQSNAQLADPTVQTYVQNAGLAFNIESRLFDGSVPPVQLTDASLLSQITYDLIDATTKLAITDPTIAKINPITGGTTVLTGYHAGTTVLVRAHWNGLADSVQVKIIPGTDTVLRIVSTPADSAMSTFIPHIAPITLMATDTIKDLYALITDSYGNFKGFFGGTTDWNSRNNNVVIASIGADIGHSEGTVLRVADTLSTTWVIASNGTYLDSVQVTVNPVTITALRLVVNVNGTLTPITTLNMRADQDTTVYVQGQRSDGKGWTSVNATWTYTSGLSFSNWVSLTSSELIIPAGSGNGKIYTDFSLLRDSLIVNISDGLPSSLVLYSDSGYNPINAASKYADPAIIDTVTAGSKVVLAANIFDKFLENLKTYRTSAASADSIVWSVVENTVGFTDSTGTFRNGSQNDTGAVTVFTPTRAYHYAYLVAKLVGTNLSDSIQIYVTPAPASQISIEEVATPTGTALNHVTSYDPIDFTKTDSTKLAYAVLRDVYGNFVSDADNSNLLWKSSDITIDTTRPERATLGEVSIHRVALAGTSLLIATGSGPLAGMIDTVNVILEDVSYDTLMIVASPTDTTPFPDTLTLLTNRPDTLYAKGKNSATGKWDLVNVKWNIESGLSAALPNVPSSSQQSWVVLPINMGSGHIYITKGSSYPDSLMCNFKSGVAASLRLYDRIGDPKLTGGILLPDSVGIIAGAHYTLDANAFDANGNYLSSYADSASKLIWNVLDDPDTTGSLDAVVGNANGYTGIKAYRTIRVVVSLLSNPLVADTISLTIDPAAAYKLTIEGSKDKSTSPNKPNRLVNISITGTDTVYSGLYAILRDKFGNFVSASTVTAWNSRDPSVVTAENGDVNFGQGLVIRKGQSGSTVVTARTGALSDTILGTDSVNVTLLAYNYLKLRIVRSDAGSDTVAINDTTISTNDNLSLYVKGLRSDGKGWELVKANWFIYDTLSVTPNPPENASTWTFSPNKPGSGYIRVAMSDSTIVGDTMSVTFTVGPPTGIVFSVDDSGIAGHPVNGTVTLNNLDGQLIGDWSGTIVITDPGYKTTITTADGQVLHPGVIINGDTIPFGDSVALSFTNGVANFQLVFYQSGAHVITGDYVDPTFIGSGTATVQISPDSAARVRIVNANGDTLTSDTVYMHGGNSIYSTKTFALDAWDNYGNSLGRINGDWTPAAIFQPANIALVNRQYYQLDVSGIEKEVGGRLVSDASGKTFGDSIYVIVLPPSAHIVGAPLTLDRNADGYLDGIDITYDRDIAIDSTSSAKISMGTDTFTIDSMYVSRIAIDSVGTMAPRKLHIILVEDSSLQSGAGQTGWKPTVYVALHNADTLFDVPSADGAGPVIWRVVEKTTIDGSDNPVVTVTFSEPVLSRTYLSLQSNGVGPDRTLHAWVKEATKFRSIDSMFLSNTSYDPTAYSFTMTSTDKLQSYNWVNILTRDSSGSVIADIEDSAHNLPPADSISRKVKVEIDGSGSKVQIGPNPMIPSPKWKITSNGDLVSGDIPGFGQRISGDNYRGTLIDMTYMPSLDNPITASTIITAKLLVFDGAGNLVLSQSSGSNLRRDDGRYEADVQAGDTGLVHIGFYWSGYAMRNGTLVPASAGMYRVVLMVDIGGDKQKFYEVLIVKN